MKRIVLIIIFYFAASFYAYPQPGYLQNVRGVVKDKVSKSPLVGANIIVVNSNPILGAVCNELGEFKIENVPTGRETFKISYMGYNSTFLNNILISSGKELILDIELEEKVFEAKEVEISANRGNDKALNEMATVSARSFTIEQTNRFAGSLGDPSRMVSNFAGVAAPSDQRNDIVIRGNSPMGVLWRLDGIDIPNPNHFGALGTTGGPVSMLNNNLLSKSDFFTGAFPAEFGNALSGAFDLRMRAGNNKKREFVGQVGFNGFELGAEGPFSKASNASYLLNYRYSTLGVFSALGIDFGPGSSIPQYQDLSFKLNFPGIKYGKFSFFGIIGKSFIQLYDSKKDSNEWSYGLSGTDTDFGTDMGVLGLSNTYFINDKTRIVNSIAVSTAGNTVKIDSLSKVNTDISYPWLRRQQRESKLTYSCTFIPKISARNNASIGVVYDVFNIQLLDSVLDGTKFRTFFDQNETIGLLRSFINWQHKFSNELSFYLGGHFQYFAYNKTYSIEPRFGTKWEFKPNQSLSFGFGNHSQLQPKLTYFYLSTLSDGTQIQSNKMLDFSRSYHYVLGYDNLISANFRFKSELYFQNLYNIPVTRNQPEFSILNYGDYFAFPLVDSLTNTGTGRNYGIEFTLEKFLNKGYYFLITTSFFQSKYIGYDGIERNTAFNNNYVANALIGYEFKTGKRSSLMLDFKSVLSGGKRYIPIILDESIAKGETVLDWGNSFTKKYPDYVRIDLRMSFRLNSKKANQEWAIEIRNLTNYKNLFMETFDVQSGKIKTEYQQGFFPMMLYRVQF